MIASTSGPCRLDGQVAVVTGGAGDIGRATSIALAQAGASVIATDILPDFSFDEPSIEYDTYDVTSGKDTDRLVDTVIGKHGRVDALILCAGTISHKNLVDASDEEWEAILRVNLMGVVNPLRRIYPIMVRQQYGKIVALGSIAAKIGGVASGPPYVAAKSAVHGLIKWVAKDGASKGVFASVVAPGPVETQMWNTVTQRSAPSPHNTVPLGRYGQPEDIAQSIAFLASPQSHWITGTVLDVNGGMLMD